MTAANRSGGETKTVSLADYRQKPNEKVVRRLELLLEEAKAGKIQGFGLLAQSTDADCRYWICGNFNSWYTIIGACRTMGLEFEREALKNTTPINDPPRDDDASVTD